MTDDVMATLQDVFRQVFNAPSLELVATTTAADVRGWDSLKHIELIMSIERRFGIKFKTAEVASMANVGDLADKVRRKRDQ